VQGTTHLPSMLVGDALRLRQVLAHLLSNALEFTTAGSVQLSVGCAVEAQQATLTYTVTDSGPGIAADRLQSIFEPFEQADPDQATHFHGTGLGLAVSAALARLLGGQLTASSREGGGSVFTLTLTLPLAATPLAAGSGGLDARAAVGAPTAPRGDNPLAGLQVLLADDNEVNLLVAKRTVERFGCVVTQAKDGREAVVRAGEQAFAIILMDCQMPELDGYGASRQIRDGGGPNARTPILALTASAFPEDRVRCTAAGMDELVAKPFRREDLEAAMLRHVARHAA
jgi:two-component system, sensor histidine kinase